MAKSRQAIKTTLTAEDIVIIRAKLIKRIDTISLKKKKKKVAEGVEIGNEKIIRFFIIIRIFFLYVLDIKFDLA